MIFELWTEEYLSWSRAGYLSNGDAGLLAKILDDSQSDTFTPCSCQNVDVSYNSWNVASSSTVSVSSSPLLALNTTSQGPYSHAPPGVKTLKHVWTYML